MPHNIVSSALVFSVVLGLGYGNTRPPVLPGIFFQQKPLQIMLHTTCSNLANRELSDACLGCFWRLSSELQEQNYTGSYSDCASRYLESTIYNQCGGKLQESLTRGRNDTMASSFCDFEKCVRQVHGDYLINSCLEKAQSETQNPVEAYVKTTSCVLCKTQCMDKKFKVQYDYGARVPILSLSEDSKLRYSVINYYSGNDELCTTNGPMPEQTGNIAGCDCTLPENEI